MPEALPAQRNLVAQLCAHASTIVLVLKMAFVSLRLQATDTTASRVTGSWFADPNMCADRWTDEQKVKGRINAPWPTDDHQTAV